MHPTMCFPWAKMTPKINLICLVLACATLLGYWHVQENEFIEFDDRMYIVDNVRVQKGLTRQTIAWAFTSDYAGNWHPLTWLSHTLDCSFFGLNPRGHHLVSVGFHVANTMLLFVLLTRMTGALWASAFTAALFALHPLHVESVAWASERKDVLSGFFWLLTVFAYCRYARKRRPVWYAMLVCTFTLGLLSKPMLVTLPCVLLLLDYWPLRRFEHLAASNHIGNPRKIGNVFTRNNTITLIQEKLPLFVLAILSSVITYVVQSEGGSVSSIDEIPLGERVKNVCVSYVAYLTKMCWPGDLAIIYPFPANGIPVLQACAAAAVLAVISWYVVKSRGRYPFLAVGWLWYLGTLVPVIGVVHVGMHSMADRYTYMPLIGIFIMISWSGPILADRIRCPRVCLFTLSFAVLGVLMLCTRSQVRYWRHTESLFNHALTATESNYIAHNTLGLSLERDGQYQEAQSHFEKAVAINPAFPPAHANLGSVLGRLGRLDQAGEHVETALRLQPDFVEARYHLGMIQLRRHQYRQATRILADVVARKPDFALAHRNLAFAYVKAGQYADGVRHYRTALTLAPDQHEANAQFGNVLLAAGRSKEALTYFYRAVALNPTSPEALNGIAWILSTCPIRDLRDGAKAVEIAKRACDLTQYSDAAILDTLAAAYAEAERFTDAVVTVKKAIDKCSDRPKIIGLLRQRLELYVDGKPYRQGNDGVECE